METLVSRLERFNTLTSTKVNQLTSYARGCVSPMNINTWKTETGGDMDNVDGYDELPDEMKEKVARAMKQGHVDDEDWKWVIRATARR